MANRLWQFSYFLAFAKEHNLFLINSSFYDFTDDFAKNVKKRSLVQFADEKEFKAILKGGDHIFAFWYKLKHFRK